MLLVCAPLRILRLSATSVNHARPYGRDWKGGTSVKILAQGGYGADALIDLKNGLHWGKISAEFAGEFFGSMPFCVELDNLKDTDAPIHQPAAMLVAAD